MRLLFLLLFSFQSLADDPHFIFLTNQAETKHQKVNPPLSQCGRLRAQQLSTILSYSNIQNIYSTTNLSAMETANPLAKKNGIPVKIFTNKLLDSLAVNVISENKNVLIVANSKTIKFLVEFISKYEISPSEDIKQHFLYQITIIDDQEILTILKQPLEC